MTFVARGSAIVVLMLASLASASAQDAAAVYKDNCASCHDAPTGRTPSRDALKDRTPETILNCIACIDIVPLFIVFRIASGVRSLSASRDGVRPVGASWQLAQLSL